MRKIQVLPLLMRAVLRPDASYILVLCLLALVAAVRAAGAQEEAQPETAVESGVSGDDEGAQASALEEYLDHGSDTRLLAELTAAGQPVTFARMNMLAALYVMRADHARAAEAWLAAFAGAEWSAEAELAARGLADSLQYLPDLSQAVAIFDKRMERADISWVQKDTLAWLLREALYRRGEVERWRQILEERRFAGRLEVLGPFSNRNREGFEQAHELERGLAAPDFTAVWPGRGRDISWQTVRVPAFGRVDFSYALYPAEEVLLYACVTVIAEEDMAATLALVQSGASKLWLNGQEIYEDPHYVARARLMMQRLVPVNLRKGRNMVVLKLAGDYDVSPQLSLRVIPLPVAELFASGSAAKADARAGLLSFGDISGEAGENPQFETAESAPLTENADGSRGESGVRWGILAELADISAGLEDLGEWEVDPEETIKLVNYTYALIGRGLDDADYSRTCELLDEACAEAPDCPYVLYRAALAQPDENNGRLLLERAAAAGEGGAAARLELARIFLRGRFFTQAREVLDSLGAERELPVVLKLRGELLRRADMPQLALEWYRKAAEAAPMDVQAVVDLSLCLPEQNLRLNALREALQRNGAGILREEYADSLYDCGRFEEAAREYTALGREFIYNNYCWQRAARSLLALGRPAEAAEVLREALEWQPEAVRLCEEAGKYLLLAGKEDEGKSYFERALSLKQDNPELQGYLRALRPQEEQFFAAADFAFEDINRPDLTAGDFPDFPSITLLDQGYILALPNGSQRRMIRIVTKVLRQEGAENAARHIIGYRRGSQQVEVIRARVIQPDGRVDENTEINDHNYSGNDRAAQMYGSEAMLKVLRLPNVAEGSVVDVQYTIEDVGEQLYHNRFCDDFFFGSDEPTMLFRYTAVYPEDMPVRYAVGNCAYEPVVSSLPGHKVLQWDVSDLPGLKFEPGMPSPAEIRPALAISSFTGWDDLGRWAWQLFAPQMEMSAQMRQKVAELVEGKSTRREKVAAIYDFVAGEIRYVSISFGRFGYTPHKTGRTFRSRYGDCKDTALLLVAMLKEAGIEAYPALVRTRSRGLPSCDLPSPGEFDHAIAYVPASGDDPQHYWLDGTADYLPLGVIPHMDRGTTALVFGPDIAERIVIDPATPEDNTVEVTLRFEFAANGAGSVTCREECSGEVAGGLVRAAERPESLREGIENLLKNRFPGALVKDIIHSPPNNEARFQTEYSVQAPHLAVQDGARLQLLPLIIPVNLSDYSVLPQRNHDLLPVVQLRRVSTATIVCDSGFEPVAIPEDVALEVPAAVFTRKTTSEGDVLTVHTEFILRGERVSPQEYAEFKKFCDAVGAAQAQLYTFSPKETADAD